MLQDYPELLLEIQDGLNRIVNEMVGHGNVTPPFERAIWRLEDTLERFIDEAQDELEAAQASGHQEAVERAEAKEDLMARIRLDRPWSGDRSDGGLWRYFQAHREAFE